MLLSNGMGPEWWSATTPVRTYRATPCRRRKPSVLYKQEQHGIDSYLQAFNLTWSKPKPPVLLKPHRLFFIRMSADGVTHCGASSDLSTSTFPSPCRSLTRTPLLGAARKVPRRLTEEAVGTGATGVPLVTYDFRDLVVGPPVRDVQ